MLVMCFIPRLHRFSLIKTCFYLKKVVKHFKMHILTSLRGAQHPNAGQNIQQMLSMMNEYDKQYRFSNDILALRKESLKSITEASLLDRINMTENRLEFDWKMISGNPAWRCRLSFYYLEVIKIYNIKLDGLNAVKLVGKVNNAKCSVSTICVTIKNVSLL